jgi:anti-sigma regulatory factor (Ser/Thr protein kinase)
MSGTGAVGNCPPVLRHRPERAAERDSSTGTAFQRWPLASRLPLGSLPSAVPCARLHARLILQEWNLCRIADNAEMIVSELVTNAIKASWSRQEIQPIELRVLASYERLMIEVWDALSAPPDLRPHAIDADSGRGLEIVSLLSDRWGFYHPSGGGKVVWAALEIGSGAAAGTQRVAQDHQPQVVSRDVGEPPPSPSSAG